MSEALSLSDRIAARLERLAEMDLAAAEHVHAQLVATSEPKDTAELSQTGPSLAPHPRRVRVLSRAFAVQF